MDLEKGWAEDDALQFKFGIVKQESVDDHAAHRVAVKKRGKVFLELLKHRS